MAKMFNGPTVKTSICHAKVRSMERGFDIGYIFRQIGKRMGICR